VVKKHQKNKKHKSYLTLQSAKWIPNNYIFGKLLLQLNASKESIVAFEDLIGHNSRPTCARE